MLLVVGLHGFSPMTADDQPTYYVRCTVPDCEYADTYPRPEARLHQKLHACPHCDSGVATAALADASPAIREAAKSPTETTIRTQRISTGN